MINNRYLMLKTPIRPFVKYKGDAIRLSSKTPFSVDEVYIGTKHHPEKLSCITTFRDSKGNIIERVFDMADGYLRNRLYSVTENTIGENEIVKSTTVKEYKLKKRMIPAYEKLLEEYKKLGVPKDVLWTPIQLITNHLSENISTGEKVLSQSKITGMQKPTKELHEIIEFPHIINNKIQKAKKKFVRYVVNSLTNKIVSGTGVSKGVRFPRTDSFLPFRVLDIDSAKYGLTEKFLKDKKLSNIDVRIQTEYSPKPDEEETSALFFGTDGTIRYNKKYKFSSKSKLAETAGHETEHVMQWFLFSRNTGGESIWQINIAQKFGGLKTKKVRNEAKRCTKSIYNYVSINEDVEKYYKNYVEIKARKAGLKAKKQYDREGQSVRKSFPHIPKELL